MKLNIINISDFPAIISLDEKNKWLFFLKKNNIDYDISFEWDKEWNIDEINSLLENNIEEAILFSSWWFDTINNIDIIWKNIGKAKKVLIWFSDTLHLQAKFYNIYNIFNIYGLTLSNICELNNKNKEVLFNLVKNQNFEIELHNEVINDVNIYGRLHWGHLMIFINILDIYWIKIIDWDILYLEFHWMEDYFIKYYLDILKNKWVFNKISWIILDREIDNYDKEELLKYFSKNWVNNIYSLNDVNFLPFYKNINIINWKLTLDK